MSTGNKVDTMKKAMSSLVKKSEDTLTEEMKELRGGNIRKASVLSEERIAYLKEAGKIEKFD
jgi:hypothetical protein